MAFLIDRRTSTPVRLGLRTGRVPGTPFNLDYELSDLAIYSIGFFIFWGITSLSSLGSWYFTVSNMNLDPTDRPS